jgi:selenide,water dikinase
VNQGPPVRASVVLVGGGHAHVAVLKSFGMKPTPDVRLTLIAKELEAPYSGMLPGHIAGHYAHDECHIDLVRLAGFAGARLIHGEAVGIDRQAKRIEIGGRPPLAYDLLSLDTGITPLLDAIAGAAEHALAVKPVSTFARRWRELEGRALQPDGPRRFAVVGAGAAGFELVLAIRHRLRERAGACGLSPDAFSFVLIGGDRLLPHHNARARDLARRALATRSVRLVEQDPVIAISPSGLRTAGRHDLPADAVLLTTKASPPAWFAETDMPRDVDGFLAVRSTLQLADDDDVFAVGDCATVLAHPRERAGVFAVRQGRPLTENIRRRLQGRSARPFRPQRRFLSLLGTGDRHAIAARGRFALAGAWVWRWKDRIDRKFVRRYNQLPRMAEGVDGAMRCGGCGAKVGPAILGRALDRLDRIAGDGSNRIVLRDDATIVDDGGPLLGIETVDFFRAFWPEPYLFGEIAANHAMSDIFAMGGRPERALAVAVLPHAGPRQSEEDLFQLLAGAKAAFAREQVSLDGGHSSEGDELALGFFVGGRVAREALLRKAGLRPGDRLILTRPLGTGILFAGCMRGVAPAAAVEQALARMRRSNGAAAALLAAGGASALTDVTGFGLAGHLIEMLEASAVSAALHTKDLPLLPAVAALAKAGVTSSLLPENLALAGRLQNGGPVAADELALLFDPQTAGGLLAGVAPADAEALLARLRAGPAPEAALIGEVLAAGQDDIGRIELVHGCRR